MDSKLRRMSCVRYALSHSTSTIWKSTVPTRCLTVLWSREETAPPFLFSGCCSGAHNLVSCGPHSSASLVLRTRGLVHNHQGQSLRVEPTLLLCCIIRRRSTGFPLWDPHALNHTDVTNWKKGMNAIIYWIIISWKRRHAIALKAQPKLVMNKACCRKFPPLMFVLY